MNSSTTQDSTANIYSRPIGISDGKPIQMKYTDSCGNEFNYTWPWEGTSVPYSYPPYIPPAPITNDQLYYELQRLLTELIRINTDILQELKNK